jgi:hypothetical protein
MDDQLAAPDVYLEREHFDNLWEVHAVFLYQNCLKTLSF